MLGVIPAPSALSTITRFRFERFDKTTSSKLFAEVIRKSKSSEPSEEDTACNF